ncbi:porin, partial [Rhizobium sp. AAP43]|uniref:porin n=1 Tax=Rhizobium sp. AAP43 TaxID=1523420 RepID=UPI0006B976F0
TGYFYIPGTETCLKIGGEVRATLNFNDDDTVLDQDNWESEVRARLTFEAKNDSEVGTIGSYIRLQASQGAEGSRASVGVDQAYITVGGFKVGRVVTWADDWGLAGESDDFFGNVRFNTATYTYATDAFSVGLGVDDLAVVDGYSNSVGIQGFASAAFGPASIVVNGVYDVEESEGGIGAVLSADLGPGTLGIAGAWASGQSAYGFNSEWNIGAAYTFKATEKLSITPQVTYYSGINDAGLFGDDRGAFTSDDAWAADLLVEYQIATGLKASADLMYVDEDNSDDSFSGFVRLTRSF